MHGVLTNDERSIIAAAHRLGLIRTTRWPLLAAHLLAQGLDDDIIAELAGISPAEAPWSVDPLVPHVLEVLGRPDTSIEDAGQMIGRVLGLTAAADPDEFTVIKALSTISLDLDLPGGVLGEAHDATEWLDCDCHVVSPERDAAIALEASLRGARPLEADPELLASLALDRL